MTLPRVAILALAGLIILALRYPAEAIVMNYGFVGVAATLAGLLAFGFWIERH